MYNKLSEIHSKCFKKSWDKEFFQNSKSDILTIENEGLIIGFVMYNIVADEAEIITICTDPEYQRCNYASKLLQQLIDKLTKNNIHKIFLDVAENNLAARRLYDNFNFEITGRRKGYYSAQEKDSQKSIDALLMTKINNI